MRQIIPERIKKLGDIIAPFLTYENESGGFVLKKDAPKEILEAQAEYHSWMDNHRDL